MRKEHLRLHHCGPEQLLHSTHLKYWPLSGRREANKIRRSYIKCFRAKPRTPEGLLIGDLSGDRVRHILRPFTTTGIDYAGPLQVRESRRRGRIHISKAWIAVFTCFATKAVHLELVTELTTESFLAALRRFFARRGICSKIVSDNDTNFVGAARELAEVYEFFRKDTEKIANHLARQKIEWSFILPRSPHFGGLWEATVKATKRHLHTVTKGLVWTFEEYSMLLVEIEPILNSRPLTPLSNDPNDLLALTPSHFLTGDSLLFPPEYSYLEIPDNKLSQPQHAQKLRQHFWKRWQEEYLHELQKRHKWRTRSKDIEVGTLVILKEDNVPPLQWVLGRVKDVHPGKDDVVRVATVKTPTGLLKRAVQKLCPLPAEEDC
ncbi:uncharacterized protein [Temnothorax longispinosus]|uniref:uncharacterized protein n=1 Tax=Temnothorax longispinosus TaxID=300112 RepID=UPI003A98F13B